MTGLVGAEDQFLVQTGRYGRCGWLYKNALISLLSKPHQPEKLPLVFN